MTVPWRLLFHLMLKEEWRLNLAFASRRGLLMFPLFIFGGAVATGLSLDSLSEDVGLTSLVTAAHLSLLTYGLFIGSFTFFGKEIMDRLFGTTSLLLGLPTTQPLSNRAVLLLFFWKDVAYYFLTTFGPLVAGLLLGGSLAGLPLGSMAWFSVGAGASFATGLACSYLLAAVYLRHLWAALALGVLMVFPLLLGFAGLAQLEWFLPSLAYHTHHQLIFLAFSWALVLMLAGLATLILPERLEGRSGRSPQSHVAGYTPLLERFAPLARLDPIIPNLLAKEWLDVMRSRTHYRMIFSLAFPLLIITGLDWFLTHSLPPEASFDFNTLFYGGMVGFFTVMLYSWLNNVDSTSFYSTLPLSVAQVVRTKVLLFLFLSTAIPLLFLSLIALATDELHLMPLALLLLIVVSIYTVSYTAEATGLRTNTYLFDTMVLLRFNIISTLPLIAVVILSDLLSRGWSLARVTGAVLGLCSLLLLATAYFWSRIEVKWGKEEFV